jgi:resuscitation-promoting factor RpfB
MRQLQAEEAERRAAEEVEAQEAEVEEESTECDPNYSGACLDPYASDYDCEGGSGNGPEYTGTVTVVGEDHYGLDADGDGVGCEVE